MMCEVCACFFCSAPREYYHWFHPKKSRFELHLGDLEETLEGV